MARLNEMAVVGMSQAGKAMGEGERMEVAAQIAADSGAVLRRYADGAEISFRLGTNVATERA